MSRSVPAPVRRRRPRPDPIWLASASPRRRQMLEDAGVSITVHPPDVDDSLLRRGRVTPEQWVMALAYFKARRVADQLRNLSSRHALWWDNDPDVGMPGVVIGADTVCVAAGEQILGQPRRADQARDMLRTLRNAEHRTITGLCLFPLKDGSRTLLVDRADVRVGRISDEQIDEYVRSGDWRGKAGAYNLSERLAAGWPIEVIGDPATVMGLPMRRLLKLIALPGSVRRS